VNRRAEEETVKGEIKRESAWGNATPTGMIFVKFNI